MVSIQENQTNSYNNYVAFNTFPNNFQSRKKSIIAFKNESKMFDFSRKKPKPICKYMSPIFVSRTRIKLKELIRNKIVHFIFLNVLIISENLLKKSTKFF